MVGKQGLGIKVVKKVETIDQIIITHRNPSAGKTIKSGVRKRRTRVNIVGRKCVNGKIFNCTIIVN